MERLDKLEYELSGLSNAVSQIAQVLKLRNQASKNKVDIDQYDNSRDLDVNKNAAKPAKNHQRQQAVWSVAKKFMLQTTIHGVSNVVSTKTLVVRILWLFMIFVLAIFCVYTIYSTTNDYLEYDVITKTKNVKEENVIFPAFIICAQEGENFIKNMNPVEICSFNQVNCTRDTDIDMFSSDRQIGKYVYECIRFNGFKENRNVSFKTFQSETDEQLRIRLIDGGVGKNHFHLTDKRLIFIVQDNYLNTLEFSKYYYIEREDNFQIYVTKTVDEKLEKPWNQCQKMNASYRQLNCIEKCKHEKIGAAYNCSLRGYYQMKDYGDFCDYPQKKKLEFHAFCESDCPEACDITEYSLTILPGTVNKTEQGKIAIFVAFQTMRHLELSQIAKMTFWDLLSSLGGTLGFLGMSFLTFVEIFEFFFEIFVNLFS